MRPRPDLACGPEWPTDLRAERSLTAQRKDTFKKFDKHFLPNTKKEEKHLVQNYTKQIQQKKQKDY